MGCLEQFHLRSLNGTFRNSAWGVGGPFQEQIVKPTRFSVRFHVFPRVAVTAQLGPWSPLSWG